jgi:uroporphyrin-III C-methyltransferase
MKGKVYLVGAGPGDPELLTIKALNKLRFADVVLHDALISREVLALASPTARLLNVGKRCGNKSITQQEINSFMINFAAQGDMVVRLKSGDPLIFGRGGEEIEARRQAGIDIEIVPGITAAVAAAAAVQISLTDRRYAEQVMLMSAHQAAGKAEPDWRSAISSFATLVIYMPGSPDAAAEGLIQAGLSRHTPCLVISNISLPEQQCYRTTVGSLCIMPPLPSPSLLIVGATAAASAIAELSQPYCGMPETGTDKLGLNLRQEKS